MTRFAIVFAAAAMLLAPTFTTTPAAADPAMKLAQVDVRVGPGGVSVGTNSHRHRHMHHRDRHMHRHHRHNSHRHHRYHSRGHAHCTTRVIIRDGRRTTVRSCR